MINVGRQAHDRRHGPRGQLQEKGSATAMFALQEVTGLPGLLPGMALNTIIVNDLETKVVHETANEFGITLSADEIKVLLKMIREETVNDWLRWWKERANQERTQRAKLPPFRG